MSEKWVRVSDNRTGHHYTVSVRAFDETVHTKLDTPAVDANGEPRLPKAKVLLPEAGKPKSSKPKTEATVASEGVN